MTHRLTEKPAASPLPAPPGRLWREEGDPEIANLLHRFGLDRPAIIGDDSEIEGEPDWIIKGILATEELGVIAGREKTLKTSIAVDVAVAIASGEPFLGHFPVDKTGPVLMFSAETNRPLFNQTMNRVLAARRLSSCPPSLGRFFRPFPLGHLKSDLILSDLAARYKPLAVIIDTWSASRDLGGERADSADLTTTSPICQRLIAACRRVNCTPIILDHTSKACGPGQKPLQLADIPYTGLAHTAGQWMILRRLSTYKNDGRHDLIVNVGGRAGHASYWKIHVDEGLVEGRSITRWDVEVEAYQTTTVRTGSEDTAPIQVNKETNLSAHAKRVLKAVTTAKGDGGGWCSLALVRRKSRVSNGERFGAAVTELEETRMVKVDRGSRKYRIKPT